MQIFSRRLSRGVVTKNEADHSSKPRRLRYTRLTVAEGGSLSFFFFPALFLSRSASASAGNKVAIINVKHALSRYSATCHPLIEPPTGGWSPPFLPAVGSTFGKSLTVTRSYRLAILYSLILCSLSSCAERTTRMPRKEKKEEYTIFVMIAYQYVLACNEMSRVCAFLFLAGVMER